MYDTCDHITTMLNSKELYFSFFKFPIQLGMEV